MAFKSLDQILLSWPTHLASVTADGTAQKSWIQLARTGSFTSTRYGKFSITKDDLRTMLHNFNTITPKPPTKLPVDYDHLSMDPKKPGDGIAAGWMGRLELREDGSELWAEVEWTPDAATRIGNKEYQFVSPSFVKDYVYKDGAKIGTTLLAAAITNHPFLEGMEALTLSAGIADMLAISETVVSLMDVGQRVAVKPEFVRDPTQVGMMFEVVEVVGEGENAFASLKDAAGTVMRWFRATELEPAAAPTNTPADGTVKPGDQPKPLVPGTPGAAVPAAPVTPGIAVPAAPVAQRFGRRSTDPTGGANPNQELKPRPAGSMMMSQTFKLRDVKGNEVEVADTEIQGVVKTVPEGAVAVPQNELDLLKATNTELKGQVTSLSTQVQSLADTAANEAKERRKLELTSRLDRLSKGGFISKPERDWAMKTFADSLDLAAFQDWASTKTTPIVNLSEVGSGADTEGVPVKPAATLMTLANSIAKDKGINLRDALMEAGRREGDAARKYREEFLPAE